MPKAFNIITVIEMKKFDTKLLSWRLFHYVIICYGKSDKQTVEDGNQALQFWMTL